MNLQNKTKMKNTNYGSRRGFLGKTRGLGRYLAVALIWAISPLNTMAGDLIVNGDTQSVAGGQYDNVFVANNGKLTVNGSLQAETVMIMDGTMTVFGTNNTVDRITVVDGGTMNVFGHWVANTVSIGTNGVMAVVPIDSTMPESGTLVINSREFTIDQGGALSGDYAGYDPRGGGGGYANSGGGGAGGAGQKGWWDASHAGPAFGDAYTYEIYMGGGGGYLGGGAITIVSDILTVNGSIHSIGYNAGGAGAGAGGGILLRIGFLSLNGTLTANGGSGAGNHGAGGGGWIKVFYGSGCGVSFTPKCSVSGFNPGKIWFDAIPDAPVLISPDVNEAVSGDNLKFSFTIADSSVRTDERKDTLFCLVELSRDNFQTVYRTYDGSISLTGWSKFAYTDGETATFSVSETMPEGAYQWRVSAKDRSVTGAYSEVRSFRVGSASSGAILDLYLTPTVIINGQPGTYQLEWTEVLDQTAWQELTTITTTNNPAVYFDLSGVGQQRRFYRAKLVQ